MSGKSISEKNSPFATVQIIVKPLDGKPDVTVDVKLSDSVASLKNKIKEKVNVDPKKQQLFFNNQRLVESTRHLGQWGLKSASSVQLAVLPDTRFENQFKLKVKTVAGTFLNPVYIIWAAGLDGVRYVKERIQEQDGILVRKQRLFVIHVTKDVRNEVEMEDYKSLACYGIHDECIIQIRCNIEIIIKSKGQGLHIDVLLSDTISSLKEKVQRSTGVPVKNQHLYFSGMSPDTDKFEKQILMDEKKKFSDYRIREGTTIHLRVCVQLKVQLLNEKTRDIDLYEDDTITGLKTKLESFENIPIGDQHIMFAIKQANGEYLFRIELQDERRISFYKLNHESFLFLGRPIHFRIDFGRSAECGCEDILFECDSSESISSIKIRLFGIARNRSHFTKFSYEGVELDDKRTLGDYNIPDKAELTVRDVYLSRTVKM